jgi:hypothetical protein
MGKSETIREFARVLLNKYRKPERRIEYFEWKGKEIEGENVPCEGDITLVVKINETTIGIRSLGDPGSETDEALKKLAKKCDIIVCASRTRGETVWAVDVLQNFATIWTSTYQIADTSLQSKVNRLKAQQIMELITELALIK